MYFITVLVIAILVFWFNAYQKDKKNREQIIIEEQDAFPKVEYSAGVKKNMPHLDIETTRKLELETEKDMNEIEIKNKDSRELLNKE